MAPIIAANAAPVHPVLGETGRPRMAKANLPKTETRPWRQEIGRAVLRAMSLRGWSLKELAAAIGRDVRQVGRWTTGEERAQLDALFAVESLRQPLVQALSELAGADVEVTVRLRRLA